METFSKTTFDQKRKKMQTLSIRLSEPLMVKVSKASKAAGLDENTIIEKALERYFLLLEFQSIHQSLEGYAQKAGFSTEEEIFEAIS